MRPEKRESLTGARTGGAVIWFVVLMALEYIGSLVSELLAITLVIAGTYAYTRLIGCRIAGRTGFGTGCVMAAPLLIYYLVIMLIAGAQGDISAFILPALTAGICEELIFRAVPISYIVYGCYGRMSDGQRLMLVCGTAVVWALAHIANGIGADGLQLATANMQNSAVAAQGLATNAATVNILLQIISAFGVGILYAAIYIRSGNILPTIIVHIAGNLAGYMRLADGMTAQSAEVIIVSITSAVLGIIYLFERKSRI